MKAIDAFLEMRLLPFMAQFYKNKYLQAIRLSFFMIMPFLLAISLLDIIQSVVLDPWGIVLGEQGLNMGYWLTGGLRGDAYGQSELVQSLSFCRLIVAMGYGILTVFLAMALSRHLASIWGTNESMTVFCAVAAYLFLLPLPAGEPGAIVNYFAERRFFSAFFVAFTASAVFAFLSGKSRLRLRIPKSLPKGMREYFVYTFPVFITVMLFAGISMILRTVQPSVDDMTRDLAMLPLYQSPIFASAYQLVVWGLWWLGIPGYAFTSLVQKVAYVPAQAANHIGDASMVFTISFFEAGVLHVLSLLIAIIVFSRHESWRKISKFTLPATLFNVQEPFVFGLPVVLNPIFLIPYVTIPVANTIVGWVAISWGIVPVFRESIPWTMPMIFGGVMSTGSYMGGMLQAVWLVMDIFIYAPFVIMANMVDFKGEVENTGTKGGMRIENLHR